MSTSSGRRQFNFTSYGQDRIAMDWFDLPDPFTQQVPIKISNNWSGTLYFRGQLNSPPSNYVNYSGANNKTIAANSSDVMTMSWGVSVSGFIASSSPVTDSLTLQVNAFVSSNFTGIVDSAVVTITNVVFNRYSGLIKVQGDDYSMDIPTPSLAPAYGGAGNMASGIYSYAFTYVKSGWESELGPAVAISLSGGSANMGVDITFVPVAGISQYAIWRLSGGATDFGTYTSGAITSILAGADLVSVVAGSPYHDSGITLLSSYMKPATWGDSRNVSDVATYLSPPAAKRVTGASGTNTYHTFFIKKNLSGTNLSGNWFVIFHTINSAQSKYISNLADRTVSGAIIVDYNAAASAEPIATWTRYCVYVSGTGASGYVLIQNSLNFVGTRQYDDVYVVSVS